MDFNVDIQISGIESNSPSKKAESTDVSSRNWVSFSCLHFYMAFFIVSVFGDWTTAKE